MLKSLEFAHNCSNFFAWSHFFVHSVWSFSAPVSILQLHKNLKAQSCCGTGILTSMSRAETVPAGLSDLSVLWQHVCSFADPDKLAVRFASLWSLGSLGLQARTVMFSGKSTVLLLRSGREVLHLGPLKSMHLWCYKADVVFPRLSGAKVHQKMNFLDLLRSFDRLENPIRLLALCKATDPLLQTDLFESNRLSYLIQPVHNMAAFSRLPPGNF